MDDVNWSDPDVFCFRFA